MPRSSPKAEYNAWLSEVTTELNTNAIRKLTVRDFPGVNFTALHRTGRKPDEAAYIAHVITEYGIDKGPIHHSPTKS